MWVLEPKLWSSGRVAYVLNHKDIFPAPDVDIFVLRIIWGWRDGLEVGSVDCHSRGPEFNHMVAYIILYYNHL